MKWVSWRKVRCPVITQNENGPCPLISIVNVLLLRGKLSLPEGCQVISAGQLLEWLADLLLDLREEDQAARPDFQHNINDAIAVLPKLQTGLDVNVRFTGVGDFEYTEDSLIFDLLDISLYHGWLVDPQTIEVAAAVANMSYNQLVETIISNRSSADSDAMSRALVAEQWLEDSRSQVKCHYFKVVVKSLSSSADLPWSGGVVDHVEGGRAGRLLPQQPLLDRAQERGATFPLGDRPGLPGEKQSGGCEM